MENERVCTVCGQEIATNYCGNCGQKVKVKQSTVLSLIIDVFSNFFSLEKSVPATMLTLLVSPNKIIDNYSKGYRNYYASPGIMIVSALTVGALHVLFVGPKLLGSSLSFTYNDAAVQFSFAVFLLLFAVLFLTISSYLAFIRAKYNFAKHLISIIYLASVFFIIIQIIIDVFSLIGELRGTYLIVIYLLLTIIWNSIVFTREKKFLSISGNILLHSLIMASFLLAFSYLNNISFTLPW